jgi:propionyl-CoA carboxylase alpha chain
VSAVDEVPADDAVPMAISFESDYSASSPVFSVGIEEADDVDIFQTIKVSDSANRMSLLFKGSPYHFEVMTPEEAKLRPLMPVKEAIDLTKTILSPMPGSVYSVAVQPGDQVVAGQELLVVEAMKMQNSIKAVKPATVKAVHVKKGDGVAADELLIELE